MDPIHIHNLLRQIASEVKCPHCKARVRPDMIAVENSTYNYCVLKIQCHECPEVFYGHAHVGVKVVPPHTQSTTSVRKFGNLPSTPSIISQNDIINVSSELGKKPCSISELFS
jgi:hypothetical protein